MCPIRLYPGFGLLNFKLLCQFLSLIQCCNIPHQHVNTYMISTIYNILYIVAISKYVVIVNLLSVLVCN